MQRTSRAQRSDILDTVEFQPSAPSYFWELCNSSSKLPGNPSIISNTEESPGNAVKGRTHRCCFQVKLNLIILAPWCSGKEPEGKHMYACTRGLCSVTYEKCDLVRRIVMGKGAEKIYSFFPPPLENHVWKGQTSPTEAQQC